MVMHCNALYECSQLWEHSIKKVICVGVTSCSISSVARCFCFQHWDTRAPKKEIVEQVQCVVWPTYADSVASMLEAKSLGRTPSWYLVFYKPCPQPQHSREMAGSLPAGMLLHPWVGEPQQLAGLKGAVGSVVLTRACFSYFLF